MFNNNNVLLGIMDIKKNKDLSLKKKSKKKSRNKKLLVIDNYDSFTYNLVQMFPSLEMEIVVKRSDKISINQIKDLNPDYILISPGPKDPENAGISKEIIKYFYDKKPILGVCLGMQCINEVFGGITKRAAVPVHGKTDMIIHDEKGIFQGMPCPFSAARYHSLIVEPHIDALTITAWNKEGLIMGVQLKDFPVFGVQFHPESFLTDKADTLIKNFLETN